MSATAEAASQVDAIHRGIADCERAIHVNSRVAASDEAMARIHREYLAENPSLTDAARETLIALATTLDRHATWLRAQSVMEEAHAVELARAADDILARYYTEQVARTAVPE